MDRKTYDQHVGPTHKTIISMIRPKSTVLEVGCSTGYMTRVLKDDLACHVVAVEIDPQQAVQARPAADKVVVGDISKSGVQSQVGSGFDYVVFADVLEHLADPDTDYGILDSTHLRFFTEKTLRQLMSRNGFRIDQFRRMFRGRIDRWLSPLCPNAFTYQFVVKAANTTLAT